MKQTMLPTQFQPCMFCGFFLQIYFETGTSRVILPCPTSYYSSTVTADTKSSSSISSPIQGGLLPVIWDTSSDLLSFKHAMTLPKPKRLAQQKSLVWQLVCLNSIVFHFIPSPLHTISLATAKKNLKKN